MEFQSAPPKSRFWFSEKTKTVSPVKVLDGITVIFSLVLAATIAIFWPVISKISFEESPSATWWLSLFEALGMDTTRALQMLFIGSYIVSTVGVYLLARFLTRRQITSVMAAIIYLIPLTSIYLVFLGNNFYMGVDGLKSFLTATYGDVTRFTAGALIPFATIFFLRYMKGGRSPDFVVSVGINSLIFLDSGPFSFNLMAVLIVCLLTELFLGNPRGKIVRFAQVVAFSFVLVSFWYNPRFWLWGFTSLVSQVGANIRYLFPLSFILGALAFLFSFVFFSKREDRQPIFISFLSFIIFLSIVLGWLWYGQTFVSYPHRIMPNLITFGAIVFALTLSAIFDKMRPERGLIFERWQGVAQVGGVLVFGALSLVILSLFAYIVSPLAVWAVSGPAGIWDLVRKQVIFDKGLVFAGSNNFKSIAETGNVGQFLGFGITALCLLFLLYLSFRRVEEKV